MNPIYVIAVTSALLVAVMATDQATKDYLLKVHNDYREKEVKDSGANNMPKLVWDATMEAEAVAWAGNCNFKHKGMGENLAWNSNVGDPETALIDKAMKNFYDEKNKYSYGSKACGRVGACHYSQLVWAQTTKVGCATKVCEPLTGAYKKAWFLVCRYNPDGNWDGENPYEKGGAPCSGCTGSTCEKGLCVGGTVGGGAGGAGGACEDDPSAGNCASWASRGECDKNKAFMHKSCKKSCNKC